MNKDKISTKIEFIDTTPARLLEPSEICKRLDIHTLEQNAEDVESFNQILALIEISYKTVVEIDISNNEIFSDTTITFTSFLDFGLSSFLNILKGSYSLSFENLKKTIDGLFKKEYITYLGNTYFEKVYDNILDTTNDILINERKNIIVESRELQFAEKDTKIIQTISIYPPKPIKFIFKNGILKFLLFIAENGKFNESLSFYKKFKGYTKQFYVVERKNKIIELERFINYLETQKEHLFLKYETNNKQESTGENPYSYIQIERDKKENAVSGTNQRLLLFFTYVDDSLLKPENRNKIANWFGINLERFEKTCSDVDFHKTWFEKYCKDVRAWIEQTDNPEIINKFNLDFPH